MAKQQHIQWLCGSVDSWNARRLETEGTSDSAFFWPDFTGADLSYELQKSTHKRRRGLWVEGFFLDSIDLNHGLFQNAELPHFSLREANLRYTNFEGASLFDSDLRKAEFTGANLIGADLSHADLRGANFSRANLTRANLGEAKLDGADLKSAILDGADFTNTKPLTSILFPDPKDRVTEVADFPKKIRKVGDLVNIRQSFENHYKKKLKKTSFNDGYMLYFRGQGKDSWEASSLCNAKFVRGRNPLT